MMITWIPYTGYGTMEQREKPPRNESFTHRDILTKREETKKKGKGKTPGIAVVIEDKPGLREWWEACTEEKITNSFGSFFSSDEISLLPKRLFRCVRTTESLADFIKKGGKR